MKTESELLANPRQCVKCGFCCRRGACPYGQWDAVSHKCAHLTDEPGGPGYVCGLYNEITERPKELWIISPAFGEGCSSPMFNVERNRILRIRAEMERHQQKEQT